MKRRIFPLVLSLLAAASVHAATTFSLTIIRGSESTLQGGSGGDWYYAFPRLQSDTAPVSYYRVESPSGEFSANFSATNTGSSATVFDDVVPLGEKLTNGAWKLWLNLGAPQEELYTFYLSTVASLADELPPVTILEPADAAANVASDTVYAWSGPSDWDDLRVEAWRETELGRFEYGSASLSPSATSWGGLSLATGTNFFQASYHRDFSSNFTASIPTNSVGTALADWDYQGVGLRAEATSGFVVAGSGASAFGRALEAPELPWTTGGDTDWFVQDQNVDYGSEATQSGELDGGGESWLETTVTGPNTITFSWGVESDYGKGYLEFYDNEQLVDAITGSRDWEDFEHELTEGPHTLRWRYHNPGPSDGALDAGFLDHVRLATDPPMPPIEFSLSITRERYSTLADWSPGQDYYYAFPHLESPEEPISYHRVEAPGDAFSANFGPTNHEASGTLFADFNVFAAHVTSGEWKLWLNKDTPQERYYTFTISGSLQPEDFPLVSITQPVDGATGVAGDTAFAWSGPDGWDRIFISAYQSRYGTNHNYGYKNLAGDAVSWEPPFTLDAGTNKLQVNYSTYRTDDFTVNCDYPEFNVESIQLETRSYAEFVVGGAPPAAPVTLLNPAQADDVFSFQFLSQTERVHSVEASTNLVAGSWQTVTNIPGDGTVKTVQLGGLGTNPILFRVKTE